MGNGKEGRVREVKVKKEGHKSESINGTVKGTSESGDTSLA